MLSLNNFQGCLKGWMQIKQENTEVVTNSRSLHFCNLKQKGRSAQTEFRRGLWIKDFKHTDQHLIHVRATHVKCLQLPNIIYSMFATPTYIQVFLLDIWNRGKCIYITKESLLHLLNAVYPFLSKGVNIVSSNFKLRSSDIGKLWTLNNSNAENEFSVELNFVPFGIWGCHAFIWGKDCIFFIIAMQQYLYC